MNENIQQALRSALEAAGELEGWTKTGWGHCLRHDLRWTGDKTMCPMCQDERAAIVEAVQAYFNSQMYVGVTEEQRRAAHQRLAGLIGPHQMAGAAQAGP
jgi:hypothetical protein